MGDYRSGRGKYKGILSASYFTGEGSGITGVTGEWDGTHVGNAEITGTLNVTQAITASAVSASAYVGDGSGLTGVGGGGSGFPFVGDAELTGSLLMRNGLSMNYNLLSQNLAIPVDHNASIIGPVGIAPGVTIDILTGSEMVIL